MKTLITGACGYTARYLIEWLERQGNEELYLSDCAPSGGRAVEVCDLTRLEQTEALIKKIKPSRIYQLAGSFSNNYETDYAANVLSSKNLGLQLIIDKKPIYLPSGQGILLKYISQSLKNIGSILFQSLTNLSLVSSN